MPLFEGLGFCLAVWQTFKGMELQLKHFKILTRSHGFKASKCGVISYTSILNCSSFDHTTDPNIELCLSVSPTVL